MFVSQKMLSPRDSVGILDARWFERTNNGFKIKNKSMALKVNKKVTFRLWKSAIYYYVTYLAGARVLYTNLAF